MKKKILDKRNAISMYYFLSNYFGFLNNLDSMCKLTHKELKLFSCPFNVYMHCLFV